MSEIRYYTFPDTYKIVIVIFIVLLFLFLATYKNIKVFENKI